LAESFIRDADYALAFLHRIGRDYESIDRRSLMRERCGAINVGIRLDDTSLNERFYAATRRTVAA